MFFDFSFVSSFSYPRPPVLVYFFFSVVSSFCSLSLFVKTSEQKLQKEQGFAGTKESFVFLYDSRSVPLIK